MPNTIELTPENLIAEVTDFAERFEFDAFEDGELEAVIEYWRENYDAMPNTREKTTIGWVLEDINCHDGCECDNACGFGQGTCGKDCFVCYSINEWMGYVEARQDVLYSEHQLTKAEQESVKWAGLPDMRQKVENAKTALAESIRQFNELAGFNQTLFPQTVPSLG